MQSFHFLFAAMFLAILVGCAARDETSRQTTELNGKLQQTSVVFRAEYYRTKGPCIQVGNTLAMPVVDGFEVVKVLSGDLKATNVQVHALTGGGPNYPKELIEGKMYTLKLTPSRETRQQLLEMEKQGRQFAWVDGSELVEHDSSIKTGD